MECVSIKPENEQELEREFAEASQYSDLIEIRLDAFTSIPEALLRRCIHEKKVILTSIKSHVELALLKPAYLDIPSTMPKELFHEIREKAPDVLLIVSYHDYEKTPRELNEIFQRLASYPAHISKCVTMANSGLDGLRMLSAVKEQSTQVIGFCMGEVGAFSRLVAPSCGSVISYMSLPNKPTAPGQYPVGTVFAKPSSKLFALIGNPVSHSLSHITHNAVFRKNNIDAIYVKIAIDKDQIDEAMLCFHKIGFTGFSVTTPLKDYFGGNTVLFKAAVMTTCNTDGIGMLDAIENERLVAGKTVLILGAGATAESIAKEALKRQATVIISNRSHDRAVQLAKKLGCQVCSWKQAVHYDILINATTVYDDPFFDDLIPGSLVADVISTKETALLQLAKKMGCERVFGHEMWVRQASFQFHFWEGLDPAEVRNLLTIQCTQAAV